MSRQLETDWLDIQGYSVYILKPVTLRWLGGTEGRIPEKEGGIFRLFILTVPLSNPHLFHIPLFQGTECGFYRILVKQEKGLRWASLAIKLLHESHWNLWNNVCWPYTHTPSEMHRCCDVAAKYFPFCLTFGKSVLMSQWTCVGKGTLPPLISHWLNSCDVSEWLTFFILGSC